MSIALATTWEDRLTDLGNISAASVRVEPTPGTATVEDVIQLRNTERRLYELVDAPLSRRALAPVPRLELPTGHKGPEPKMRKHKVRHSLAPCG